MAQTTEPSVHTADDWTAAFTAALAGERVVVERDGQRVAMISMEDLEFLLHEEQAELAALAQVAREAWAEHEASGEALVPWDEVKTRAGLD